MEIITSRTNSRIKNIVNLINNKKERLRQKLFVIEGVKVLEEAVKSQVSILMILMTQKFCDDHKHKMKCILSESLNLAIITEDICNKISNNVAPQGIFAICKMLPYVLLQTVLDNGKNVLMILNIQDVGNFGTIIRTAYALGIDYIVVNKECPDIYNFKVLRSAMGAAFNIGVAIISEPVESMRRFRNKGFTLYASAVIDSCENIQKVKFTKKNLIIIGNEGNGLDYDVIEASDKVVKIPMVKEADSLNVAVATGILLWELQSRYIDD